MNETQINQVRQALHGKKLGERFEKRFFSSITQATVSRRLNNDEIYFLAYVLNEIALASEARSQGKSPDAATDLESLCINPNSLLFGEEGLGLTEEDRKWLLEDRLYSIVEARYFDAQILGEVETEFREVKTPIEIGLFIIDIVRIYESVKEGIARRVEEKKIMEEYERPPHVTFDCHIQKKLKFNERDLHQIRSYINVLLKEQGYDSGVVEIGDMVKQTTPTEMTKFYYNKLRNN